MAASVGNPLDWESRVRTRQAVIAGAAGVCLIAGTIIQSAVQPKVSELTEELITIDQHGPVYILGGVVNALGIIGLALTLNFLFWASRARRPETASTIRLAALVGGVLAAIGGIADAILLGVKAHDFVSHGAQTYVQANTAVSGTGIAVLQYAGLLGALALAIAFILVAMNAMRVGLLTRFLGYLGMAAALSSVFLLGSPVGLLIEVAWLVAVAYLLSGRWPNGDPPAWVTGKAEPWPSSAELREQRQRAGARGARSSSRSSAGAEPAKPAAPVARSTNPKRKRKRRK